MYKVDLKNKKKGYVFGSFFLIVGLLFFLVVLYLTFNGMVKKQGMDASVEATYIDENSYTDSDGDVMYSPIYHYIVDGVEYTCRVGYSSSKRISSTQTMVYYKSGNPSDAVSDYTVEQPFYMYLICLFPIIFIIAGSSHMVKIYKSVKKTKYLAVNGQLIQKLEYVMEKTNIEVNGRELYAIAVDYTLPSGEVVRLIGDPRYDRKLSDEDGLVDLLIDPEDASNYYIDFNISVE